MGFIIKTKKVEEIGNLEMFETFKNPISGKLSMKIPFSDYNVFIFECGKTDYYDPTTMVELCDIEIKEA